MTLLAAATGAGVARFALDGDVWQADLAARESGISCLGRDPRDADFLLGGARGGGVWRSGDGGEHWEQLDFPHPDVFSVAVSPADGAVYAGCEPSMLFVSRDRGETWAELESLREIPSAPTWSFPPRPWTSHVRWIAPSPHDAMLLLVGIELGGVMRSEDGGATWSDHRPGAQLDCHSLAWHPARDRPRLRGRRRRGGLERGRRRHMGGGRRGARPPLHLGGSRRPAGSRLLVRLGEHGPVRGPRARIGPGVRLSLARPRALGATGRRPAAAPGADALRARVRERLPHSRARRRDGLRDPGRRGVLVAGQHRGRPTAADHGLRLRIPCSSSTPIP